jgi:hypothetical protein
MRLNEEIFPDGIFTETLHRSDVPQAAVRTKIKPVNLGGHAGNGSVQSEE